MTMQQTAGYLSDPNNRHARAGGCPEKNILVWIPAFAGMTKRQ